MTKTIAVLTIWRDNEKILDRALSQYETMEDELIPKGFRFTYAFLENDSKDETAMRLYKWVRERRGFLVSEQIDAPKCLAGGHVSIVGRSFETVGFVSHPKQTDGDPQKAGVVQW